MDCCFIKPKRVINLLFLLMILIVLSFSVSAFTFSEDFSISDAELRANYNGYDMDSNLQSITNILNDSYWYLENNSLVINATNSGSGFYVVEYDFEDALGWHDYQTNVSFMIDNQISTSNVGVAVHTDIERVSILNLSDPKWMMIYKRDSTDDLELTLSDGFKVGDDDTDKPIIDGEWFNLIITTNTNDSTTTFPISIKVKTWNSTSSEPSLMDINMSVGGGAGGVLSNGSIFFSCAEAICYFDNVISDGLGITPPVVNCTPDWSCSGYTSCNITDLAPCNNVTDSNICGENYTGNYSEFTPQSCNYCISDSVVTGEDDCQFGQHYVYYEDLNYETCCNITQLPSDCPLGNFSIDSQLEECENFVPDYDEGDITDAIIDMIVKYLIVFSIFVTLLIFIMVGKWSYKKVKKK